MIVSTDDESLLPEFDRSAHETDEVDTTRPALRSLTKKQQEQLRRFQNEGFESRADLLEWLHEIQFHTLGRIEWPWFYRVATQRASLSVVITDADARSRPDNIDVSAAEARRQRRLLTTRFLRPACRAAYRELRTAATEYLDDERPDPEETDSWALRPALNEYHEKQHDAINRFVDGLEDVDALLRWLQDLDDATFGCMREVEDESGFEWDHQLVERRAVRRVVLGDEEKHENMRERMVARYLLPATNLSARILAEKSGEWFEEISRDQEAIEV